MSERKVVTCDECGSERRGANQWFSILGSPSAPRLFKYHEADYEAEKAENPDFRLDYCGQRCLVTAIQRWQDIGTVVEPVALPRPRPVWNPTSGPQLGERLTRLAS
jgi:hypothetical protein